MDFREEKVNIAEADYEPVNQISIGTINYLNLVL
jgi:hypothetical protein